jgi:hypothetical protein
MLIFVQTLSKLATYSTSLRRPTSRSTHVSRRWLAMAAVAVEAVAMEEVVAVAADVVVADGQAATTRHSVATVAGKKLAT